MDAIVYGDLRVDLQGEHGGRIQHDGRLRTAAIGAGPHLSTVVASGQIVGRDAEVAIGETVAAGHPIEFHAPCGYGKSTLLRHLAGRLASRASVPVVYLRVGGMAADDLRQGIVAALYTADIPFKPTREQSAQLLAQARAVILLDDVSVGPSKTREIVDELPHCAIIIGCDRPLLGRRGRSVTLAGLPTAAALELLRADLGRDLTASEDVDAQRLCEVVDGQPLHVRQAAALVREGRHSLADIVRIGQRDAFALDRLSVDALAEPHRRVLALLAFAGGALLPTDLVGAITDVAETGAILASLRRRGLVEQDDDRFGLPVCHAGDYRAVLLGHLALGEAARVLADWIRRQGPAGPDVQAVASAALSIIGYAAERAEWPAVVDLVEAIEPVLALAGRWTAWGDALTKGLAAARRVSNLAAQGQMNHQLGVHAFVAGHPDQSAGFWQEAARIREQINNSAGAAVTRSNLALLTPAPPVAAPAPRRLSPRRLPGGPRVWTAAASAVAVAVAVPVAHGLASNKHSPATAAVGRTEPQVTTSPITATDQSTPGNHAGGSSGRVGSPEVSNGKGGRPGGGGGQGSAAAPSVWVSPTSYTGSSCPHVFSFTGVIRVAAGPVTVRYKWIRSDGAIAPEQTVSFSGTGSQQATVGGETWTLSANGTHWEAIQILSPGTTQSNHATFTLNCQPPG